MLVMSKVLSCTQPLCVSSCDRSVIVVVGERFTAVLVSLYSDVSGFQARSNAVTAGFTYRHRPKERAGLLYSENACRIHLLDVKDEVSL